MKDLLFFDATLRDGSHAVRHQISLDDIKDYCSMIDDAGLYTVIVGHGNGLGASSLQVGLSLNEDDQMLAAAKLKKTKLGVYMIPGFGTIKENLKPAILQGAKVVKIGCHCTEADTTCQHIEFACINGTETYGVLMMAHMASPAKLLEQAKIMVDSGALGVILMDSSGNMLPEDVKERITCLADSLNGRVGFHAHNNLGLAVANTLVAIESGATIVDATLRGFGAGAGNAPLEVIAGVLQKMDIPTHLNLYKVLDVCDSIVATRLQKKPQEISSLSLVSGLSGVFSSFAEHVKSAAENFNVDPRDIFWELGRRKVVGGQEDIIVDVAMNLAQQSKADETSYLLESLL